MLCWDWQDVWIYQQGIPNPASHAVPLHVHHLLIPYMGMPIIYNADLEARPLPAPKRVGGSSSSSAHRS